VANSFSFKERLSAEFKAEIFDVFNHPWFANPYGGPGGQNVDPTGQPFVFVGLTPDTQASNPVLHSGGARDAVGLETQMVVFTFHARGLTNFRPLLYLEVMLEYAMLKSNNGKHSARGR